MKIFTGIVSVTCTDNSRGIGKVLYQTSSHLVLIHKLISSCSLDSPKKILHKRTLPDSSFTVIPASKIKKIQSLNYDDDNK